MTKVITIRKCMTCDNETSNKSGFCSVRGWDSCKNVFVNEYGSLPTKEELKE